MRFLVVDDSSTMRRIIINTLNKLGHQDVAEAGNGREGLVFYSTLDAANDHGGDARHRRSKRQRRAARRDRRAHEDFIKFGVPTPSSQEIETVCRDRHAEIGARLLRQWQLPEALESPVRYHHDPAASPTHSHESAVTYMANRLSHRYGFVARHTMRRCSRIRSARDLA